MMRTGVLGNRLVDARYYEKMKMLKDKVKDLETFEQILVDRMGYQVRIIIIVVFFPFYSETN